MKQRSQMRRCVMMVHRLMWCAIVVSGCVVFGTAGIVGEFMALPMSVRAAGMGGCGVVGDGGDPLALLHNPANVCRGDGVGLVAGYHRYLGDLFGVDAGVVGRWGRWGAGVMAVRVEAPPEPVFDQYGNPVGGTLHARVMQYPVVAGYRWGRWTVGAGVRGYQEEILDWSLRGATGALGVVYDAGRLALGFAAVNMGKPGDGVDQWPEVVRVGGRYRAGAVMAAVEASDGAGDVRSVRVGGEVKLWSALALRVGLFAQTGRDTVGGTLGFGIRRGEFGFDYAAETQDYSAVHRTALLWMFGGVSEPREAAETDRGAVSPPAPSGRETVPAVKPGAPVERGAGQAREPMTIAVAEFTGKNVSQADASIVSDFLRTELVNLGGFTVVERANMDKLLAEAGFQQLSGCTEAECAVQMGRILNVQVMLVGSVSKLMDTFYITVNMVQVETGRILASYDQDAMTARELRAACRTLAQKIAAR